MINQILQFGSKKLFRPGTQCLQIVNQKFMSTKQRYDLKGRVALVTGAASGIGAEVSKALLEECVKGVMLCDINEELCKETYCKLAKCYGPQRVQYTKCNVLCPDQIEIAFEKTVACYNQLDIVSNNAAILDETDVHKAITINLTAVIISTQLAIEKYLPKYRSCREGVVLNTASIFGHTTIRFAPTYCAVKHGIVGLGKCYGDLAEYKQCQTRVMSLCPGLTDTPFLVGPIFRPQHMEAANIILAKCPRQTVEVVAKAAIHMLKCGKPGSSWFISNGKMEEAKIVEAYNKESCYKMKDS